MYILWCQVNLALVAHTHSYERTCLIKNGNCVETGGTQHITGKSLSEAFILTSNDPKYDKRLFIYLPVQYVKTTSSENGENMLCTQIVFSFLLMFSELVVFMYWTSESMNNLLSYCGLVAERIRPSNKDLPVI